MRLFLGLFGVSVSFLLSACVGYEGAVQDAIQVAQASLMPSTAESVGATQQALEKGIKSGVASLNRAGGFSQSVHKILIPKDLQKASEIARTMGLNAQVDSFEKSLNRAAEQAVGAAVPVFQESLKKLSFQDVVSILKGSDRAATEYFQRTSQQQLLATFRPIVAKATDANDVGKLYKQLATTVKPAAALAGVPMPSVDLDQYVSEKAVEALFQEIGKQEQLIRKNPAERTTALLQKVFTYYAQPQKS
jgi:hypothetical protein